MEIKTFFDTRTFTLTYVIFDAATRLAYYETANTDDTGQLVLRRSPDSTCKC